MLLFVAFFVLSFETLFIKIIIYWWDKFSNGTGETRMFLSLGIRMVRTKGVPSVLEIIFIGFYPRIIW